MLYLFHVNHYWMSGPSSAYHLIALYSKLTSQMVLVEVQSVL